MTVSFTDRAHQEDLPWVEKYRPRRLDDVLGHRDVLQTLKRFVQTGSLPHILLHGPPGTGKTTIIKALALAVYGDQANSMVLELNASDERGIDTVRKNIKEFASARKLTFTNSNAEYGDTPMAQLKLVVLDEADQMTSAAQMALRRIIEQYSASVRFVIICNFMNRINAALQSRCTKFRMPPLRREAVRSRVVEVCDAEGIEYTMEGIDDLIKLSKGDMRNIMNTLESCHMMDKGTEGVHDALGIPSREHIDRAKISLLEDDFSSAHDICQELRIIHGYRLVDIVERLYESTVEDDWPFVFIGILIPRLDDIVLALNEGADEDLQTGALVAAYIEARYALFRADAHAATESKAKNV